MHAYITNNNNGSSNNLPCLPPVINFRMLSIGGQGRGGIHKRSMLINMCLCMARKGKVKNGKLVERKVNTMNCEDTTTEKARYFNGS